MKKRMISMLAFSMAVLSALALIGCGFNTKLALDEAESDVPAWLADYPPEGILWGVGVAETESDGESILLAEDRARTGIASQLNRQLTVSTYEYAQGDKSAEVTQLKTSKVISCSEVARRYKDKNGMWWCLVELTKENAGITGIEPAQNDIAATLRSNRENWPDIKNAVTLDTIPDWVIDCNTPEDTICAVGAAKLGNDKDAVYLAMERARRSLARSLSAQINYVFSDYPISESESYQESGASVTSVYEYTPIPALLMELAKTKDGTLWVMLGYPKNQLKLHTK